MEQRCDQKPDCGDESDEQDCDMLVHNMGYDKHIAPPALPGMEEIKMKTSVDVMDIQEINEVAGLFTTKYVFIREWFDQRLTFQNLKPDSNMNRLSPKDQETLWYPWVDCSNIKNENSYQKGGVADVLQVIPKNTYNPKLGDNTYSNTVFLFSGTENYLRSIQVRSFSNIT